MATVQVRYIVKDVDRAIAFYDQHLGFQTVMHPSPAFAMLSRGDLRLVLSAPNPAAGGGQAMPDGTKQEPGGWNRFAIEVDDLAATVERLRHVGAISETRSSRALEANRSSSMTLPAIRLNSFNRL
jgi:catechol 2,3-dioxygenase-like lactoylglutathione lyase family enzyme